MKKISGLSFIISQFILLLTVVNCSGVYAQNNKARKQVYAVLVGVAKYSTPAIDLYYADTDAIYMNKKLLKMRVPADNIILLTDFSATKAAIINSIKSKFEQARPQDEVIFFFSGHGGPGFLVSNDIPNYLYYEDLKEVFRSCKATQKIIFADACYSGVYAIISKARSLI